MNFTIPTTSNYAVSSASAPSPWPASQTPSAHHLQGFCASKGCRKACHRSCGQPEGKMCKPCCIMRSGCSAPGHQFKHLSARQQQKLTASQPPSASPPALATPTQPPLSALPPVSPAPTLPPTAYTSYGDFCDHLIDQFMPEVRIHEEQERCARQRAQEEAVEAARLEVPQASPLTPQQPTSLAVHPTRSISQHLNPDWMRPYQDFTSKPRTGARRNVEHRFRVVFWEHNDKPPIICAVHECPAWPKWVLADASLAVRDELSLTQSDRLLFYDVGHRQWVSCTPSYPHDVKKDGYLFLRRHIVTNLVDFDLLLSHVVDKPVHFRKNIADERAYIREQLYERRKMGAPSVEDLNTQTGTPDPSQDNLATPIQTPAKRPLQGDSVDSRPSHRMRLGSSPFSQPSSPLPHASSPIAPSNDTEIIWPSTPKPWPYGMYTVDMKNIFWEVGQMPKDLKLEDRLLKIFGKKVSVRTYHEQKNYWKRATEVQRQAFVNAGRTKAGLWAAFRSIN